MNDDRTIRTLRAQAWARAKGELEAVMQTYWNEPMEPDSKYTKMQHQINLFVENVEDDGLAE